MRMLQEVTDKLEGNETWCITTYMEEYLEKRISWEEKKISKVKKRVEREEK